MRRLRNTFNTAAQLPSDILVMIPSFLPEDFDLLVLSHVCHRWRTIVNSCPLLWGRMDCRDLNRTVIALEHLRSAPLRLKLNRNFSTDALNAVLGHGRRITSVFADISPGQIESMHRCLAIPSVEELVLFIRDNEHPALEGTMTMEIEGEFMSMRKLFVSGCLLPIDRITATNLIHLSLEAFTFSRFTAQPVLDLLRGCSLLETVLISIISSTGSQHVPQSHGPVKLQKLHSIELGEFEVRSGLMTLLQFPPGVAVGFRGVNLHRPGTWPYESVRHVLATIDIESVTVSYIRHTAYAEHDLYLLRFEGVEGSLEVNVSESGYRSSHNPGELLLSPSLRLENVKTLRLMDCFGGDVLNKVEPVMPNLVSIQFVGRNQSTSIMSLIPVDGSPAQFPCLEHIAGLSVGPSLVRLARLRKRMGVPLSCLEVNDGADDWSKSEYCRVEDAPRYIEELKGIVEDVKVCNCGYLPERWTNNAILDVWEGAGHPGPVSVDVIEARARWPDRLPRIRLNGSMLTIERSTT